MVCPGSIFKGLSAAPNMWNIEIILDSLYMELELLVLE